MKVCFALETVILFSVIFTRVNPLDLGSRMKTFYSSIGSMRSTYRRNKEETCLRLEPGTCRKAAPVSLKKRYCTIRGVRNFVER
jgi:hypothetical protein